MKIAKYEFPDDRRYDATHNWARQEGDEVVQGMSSFGQALAGEIMYVEPAAVGREVKRGAPVLAVESGKWVGRITATVSGTIVAFNPELEWEPALVNQDAYGRGWMIRIRPNSLEEDWARLQDPESEEFRAEVRQFIEGLVSHYVLDGGRLVVCHAGLPEKYHGRTSGRVRSHALYGDTTGETDEFGLPVRYPWANDYRGSAIVVYGHTPVPEAEWINNTICIDTGCVFGGKLTALRYPERELVSVPAARTYWEPTKPLHPATTEAERPAELFDATDVLGKRIVDTRLQPRITVGAENAAAAFEVMSRWAIDPRWLIYLPPTMAPTATSARQNILEHPTEAFAAYRRDGIVQVICEEKHMGSRAVVIVCRDAEVAARRFKIDDLAGGTVYTRTGRAFFNDPAWQAKVIERTRALGLGSFPGVFTASECFSALRAGATALKIFPANVMRPEGLSALRAVLPAGTDMYPPPANICR